MGIVTDAVSAVVHGFFRWRFGQTQRYRHPEVGLLHGPFSGLCVHEFGFDRLLIPFRWLEQADDLSVRTRLRLFHSEFISGLWGDRRV